MILEFIAINIAVLNGIVAYFLIITTKTTGNDNNNNSRVLAK